MVPQSFAEQLDLYKSTCFLCGVSSRDLTDEHVVPAWLLRRLGLYKYKALLPNGSPLSYAQRSVPACRSCNSMMGSTLEQPISRAIGSSALALADKSLAPVVRMWMTKILIGSMHCQAGLRDDLRDLNSLPQTNLTETMGATEPFRQELLAFLTRGGTPSSTDGSVLVFETGTSGNAQSDFDLLVHPNYRMVGLRAGKQGVIHIIGDHEFGAAQLATCGLLNHYSDLVLNPMQFRDLYATCAALRWATPTLSLKGFDSPGTSVTASPLPDESRPFIHPGAFVDLRHELFASAITKSYGMLVPALGFCTTYAVDVGPLQSSCFFYACPRALATINLVPPFDCPVCGAGAAIASGSRPEISDIFQLLLFLDGQQVPSRTSLPEGEVTRVGLRAGSQYGHEFWDEHAEVLLAVPGQRPNGSDSFDAFFDE